MTGGGLWPFVLARAACSNNRLNPDDWYPVSVPVAAARREAAAAIAVCAGCPVRGTGATYDIDGGQQFI
jgi:hypothetical protein